MVVLSPGTMDRRFQSGSLFPFRRASLPHRGSIVRRAGGVAGGDSLWRDRLVLEFQHLGVINLLGDPDFFDGRLVSPSDRGAWARRKPRQAGGDRAGRFGRGAGRSRGLEPLFLWLAHRAGAVVRGGGL